MSNKRMIPQHEVLRTPQGWTGQERDFVVQLERIHDDIYRRLNKRSWEDYTVLQSGDDCNNAIQPGAYYIKSGVANSPTSWAWMFVGKGTEIRDYFQIMFNTNGLWVRSYIGTTPSWQAWKKAVYET